MEFNRDRIISKVRACLARADARRNDSDAEREIALRQANALMDKHAIDILEVTSEKGLDGELGERGESEQPTGASLWKSIVFGAIAKLYGCYMHQHGSGRSRTVVITGRLAMRNTVIDISEWIIASIEREARTRQAPPYESNRSFRHGFRVGAAHGVHEVARRIAAERMRSAEAESSSTALALVEHYRHEYDINQAIARAKYDLRTARGATFSSGTGFASGRSYGKSINLSGQVNHQRPRLK